MAREHSCTSSRAAVSDALAAAMMSRLEFAAGLFAVLDGYSAGIARTRDILNSFVDMLSARTCVWKPRDTREN